MTQPTDADIAAELLRTAKSAVYLSPDGDTLVAILNDPHVPAYMHTPGHRMLGRLAVLPNPIPNLPVDEEIPTPEDLTRRIEKVCRAGGYAFPLWHDPEVTGAYAPTWELRKPPADMSAPRLLGAYLMHPSERVYRAEDAPQVDIVPGHDPDSVQSVTRVMPTSEARSIFEQLRQQIADLLLWNRSGTYMARVYRLRPCPHCGRLAWHQHDQQRALHGYNDALFFLQLHPFTSHFAASGENAWPDVSERYPDLLQGGEPPLPRNPGGDDEDKDEDDEGMPR